MIVAAWRDRDLSKHTETMRDEGVGWELNFPRAQYDHAGGIDGFEREKAASRVIDSMHEQYLRAPWFVCEASTLNVIVVNEHRHERIAADGIQIKEASFQVSVPCDQTFDGFAFQ